MTPRPARRRWRRILLTLATGTVLTLALGLYGCLSNQPHDPLDANIPAGDNTPFHERQSLEDYAATVPPAIIEFQEQLTRAGAGEWEHDPISHQFSISYCVEPDKKKGNLVRILGGEAGVISVEKITWIGDEIFVPLGYARTSRQMESGVSLAWVDWHSGGHIELFVGKSKIGVYGDSECRPSTDPERVRFELQALAPLPSESPVQSSSPAPTRTRSIATRRTGTGKTHP